MTAWQASEDRGVQRWSAARGPVDAARLTLLRLGWAWTQPFVLSDAAGVEYVLGDLAPAAVERALVAAVGAQLEQVAAARLAHMQFEGDSVSAAAVRRTLAGKKLSNLERGTLRAIASGAVWTRARLAEAGYDVSPACPLCTTGAADTIYHRAWLCPATEDLRQGDENAALARRARQAGPDALVYSTGLIGNPALWLPPPATSTCEEATGWEQGAARVFEPGPVYVDGSCVPHVVPELSRAAWAVVQTDEQGQVLKSISGVVPACLPQTAQAGEYLAMTAAAQHVPVDAEIHSDCKGVVTACLRGPQQRRLSRRMHGWGSP